MRFAPRVLSTGIGIALGLAALLPHQARADGGTLQKIKDTGTITLGYRESSAPFSYLDDNQKPVGYAMDICTRIVDAVKKELSLPALKVELTPVTSATRIPLMANGTIDLECGSTTNNVDREKQVSFTNTHFLTASIFVGKKSANLHKIDDLKGKIVASTAGSTNIGQLDKVNADRKLGITVVPVKDHAEGILMVETGRAAAFVMDDVIIAGLVASAKNPAMFALGDEAFSKPEPYGIMLRKDDPSFKALVDKTTAAFFKTEGPAVYAKWFTQPIPPKGINMNLPLSPAMAKAMKTPSDNPDPASYAP
ncbi:MAG: amino acid ABC transporter substrate-binding protein [Acetobacteraceae bacterium]|nr:amino acid ABC transporter substrate-binding protein [Acetobacteraceae bacterium]